MRLKIAKMLVDEDGGATVHLVSKWGKTASDIAREKGDEPMLILLEVQQKAWNESHQQVNSEEESDVSESDPEDYKPADDKAISLTKVIKSVRKRKKSIMHFSGTLAKQLQEKGGAALNKVKENVGRQQVKMEAGKDVGTEGEGVQEAKE